MTDKNDPDKKIEETDSTAEPESLEIKEGAFDASQDDEEIIDLIDAV